MASRIGRMTRAGDHCAGNFCGEDHSARVPSVNENVDASCSLRDLSGGNGNVGESTAGEHPAKDQCAENSSGDHSAGDQVAG